QPSAIVEGRAPIPIAVPGVRLDGCAHEVSMLTPPCCASGIANASHGFEQIYGEDKQPPQPYAFAPAGLPTATHAVVPIARTDQWQTVCACQVYTLIQAARAMFEQGRGFFSHCRLEEDVMLVVAEGRTFQKWDLFVQNSFIIALQYIAGDRIAQPDPVIRNAGSNALPGLG